MTKFEKIKKLTELKTQLGAELLKEEKDLVLIKKLRGNIMSIGITLTSADFTKF